MSIDLQVTIVIWVLVALSLLVAWFEFRLGSREGDSDKITLELDRRDAKLCAEALGRLGAAEQRVAKRLREGLH